MSKGIIIADTKFEFGLDENGNVVLGDEMSHRTAPDSGIRGYEAMKILLHPLTNSLSETG